MHFLFSFFFQTIIFFNNNCSFITILCCCELAFACCVLCSPLGARSQSASVLASLQELKDIRDELNNKESQLRDAEHQLTCLKGTADKYVARRVQRKRQMQITDE